MRYKIIDNKEAVLPGKKSRFICIWIINNFDDNKY